MRYKYVFLFVIIQLFFIQAFAQIRVYRAGNSNPLNTKDGLFYSLPRTLLKVDVIVELRENIPGPLNEYAEKYLGLGKVIQEQSSHYEIKEVRISTFTQPDPEQSFFVYIDKKSKEDKSFNLSLTKSGIIKGVNLLNTVGQVNYEQVNVNLDSNNEKSLFNYFADHNFYQHIDTIVRRISIDTASFEQYFYNTTWLEKNLEQKAKETSEFIAKLRENRFLLLTGYQETNYAGSMVYMDTELKKMEAEYLSLFIGRTKKELILKSFVYLPQKNTTGNQMVFNFSEKEGFISGQSRGTGVQIKIIPQQNSSAIDRFVQAVTTVETSDISGFYYCIPEQTNIQLLYNGEIIHETQKLINQFGIVVQSPSLKSEIEFDTETGMIKNIKVR